MMLWEGTEFAELAEALQVNPQLMNAWRMGVCEQTVADLLGVEFDDSHAPEVARAVASRMMHAFVTGQGFDAALMECAELIRQNKARAN